MKKMINNTPARKRTIEKIKIEETDDGNIILIRIPFTNKKRLIELVDGKESLIMYSSKDSAFRCKDESYFDVIKEFVDNLDTDIKKSAPVVPKIEPRKNSNEEDNKRYAPPKSSFESSGNFSKKEEVTLTQYDNGDIYIRGDLYNYKEQLKQIIPYGDRKWDPAEKAWIVRSEHFEVLQDFVSKIQEKLLPKDTDMNTIKGPSTKIEQQNKYTQQVSAGVKDHIQPVKSDLNNQNLVQTIGNNVNLFNNDGLTYQVLVSVVVAPKVGQFLELYFKENNEEVVVNYEITKIISSTQFLAKPETEDDGEIEEHYFVVSAGVWTHQDFHTYCTIKFLV